MGRIVPANFPQLVVNVIPAPGFLFTIAANTCSVKPYLYAQTLLPAALYLFARIAILEVSDVIVDQSRRAAHAVAKSKGKKTRQYARNLGKRQAPNRAAKLTRFLFFPIGVVELVGFTYLLASFNEDLSFSWTTILSTCDACSDSGASVALGPLVRSIIPGDQFLNTGFVGIPMTSLDQNRAGWITTLQSVTLPQGRWNIVCSATVSEIIGGAAKLRGRLRVRRTVLGIPFTTTDDAQEVDLPETGTTDLILATTISVPPTETTTVTWQWETDRIGIYGIKRHGGDVMVTGQSSCAT